MRAFTADELTRMRGVQNDAMLDTCTINTWHATQDDYGTEINVPIVRAGVACGLDVSGGGQQEQRRDDGTVAVIIATLRMALADGESITAKDSITVTHRNGEALTPPLTYGIDGPVRRGPTGIVLGLMEVQ
jgi:hypothetical protein